MKSWRYTIRKNGVAYSVQQEPGGQFEIDGETGLYAWLQTRTGMDGPQADAFIEAVNSKGSAIIDVPVFPAT